MPAKSLRQMLVVLVPAAAGVSAGLSRAWTSLGAPSTDRASVWALDLHRQVGLRVALRCCKPWTLSVSDSLLECSLHSAPLFDCVQADACWVRQREGRPVNAAFKTIEVMESCAPLKWTMVAQVSITAAASTARL